MSDSYILSEMQFILDVGMILRGASNEFVSFTTNVTAKIGQ